MVEVYCAECGTKFEANSKMAHLCPACKDKRKEQAKEYSKEYAKKRAETLGIVTIQIYKEDRDKLKAVAKDKGCSVAEVLKDILNAE